MAMHYCLCALLWVTTAFLGVSAESTCPEVPQCNCSVTYLERTATLNRTESVIDCSKRDLTSVPEFAVLTGKEFDKMLLNGNLIVNLHKDAFRGVKVKFLDLSDNHFSTVSDRAMSALDQLQELAMRNCSLTSAPNTLQFMSSLRKLSLRDNQIGHLSKSILMPLGMLQELDLSNNPKIQFASPFQGLVQLTHLNLANCALPNLPTDVLSDVRALKTLNVSHNDISRIPDGVFQNVPNLEVIDLDENPLTIQNFNVFHVLPALKVLKLGRCAMPSVTATLFSALPHLTTLAMKNCHIKTIEAGTLQSLIHLTSLDLSGNPELTLTKALFSGMEHRLTELGLANMNLDTVDALSDLDSVRVFRGSGNNFGNLNARHFAFITQKTAEVYLDKSNINDIDEDAFENLIPPFTLSLRGNNITSLTFLSEEPCEFDRSHVDVSNNPINCDCSTHKFVQMKSMTLKGTCRDPVELKGIRLLPPYKHHPTHHHLEKKMNRDCSVTERFTVRYDCSCRTWLNLHALLVCDAAPAHLSVSLGLMLSLLATVGLTIMA